MIPIKPDDRALQVVGPLGRGLRVTFIWDEDRYRHEIAVLDGSAAIIGLRSDLGRDRDPWPTSPPLQQLSLEEFRPARSSALLVGMAGKSHWSQSVETDAATTSLIFDVACRVQEKPDWLGSSYQTIQPQTAGIFATPKPAQLEVTAEPIQGSPPAGVEAQGGILVISPVWSAFKIPSTIRWRYRVTVRVAGS